MDGKTGQIVAALMTQQDTDDAGVLPDLLDQIPSDVPVELIGGDGKYDTKACHAAIAARSAVPSILPPKGAVPWLRSVPGAAWRNEAIRCIAQFGRAQWKKRSGYQRLRSRRESNVSA